MDITGLGTVGLGGVGAAEGVSALAGGTTGVSGGGVTAPGVKGAEEVVEMTSSFGSLGAAGAVTTGGGGAGGLTVIHHATPPNTGNSSKAGHQRGTDEGLDVGTGGGAGGNTEGLGMVGGKAEVGPVVFCHAN